MKRCRRNDAAPAARWSGPVSAIVLAAALLLPGMLASGPRATPATYVTAAGTLEGTVTLPSSATAKTTDRYVSDTGEAREIQGVPVVVYLEGNIASSPAPRPSGPTELVQRGEAFQPTLLVVPVGAQVRFPNDDPLFHNVFSYSRPKRFDLGRYRRGESKTVVFDKPGYVKVMCEVHKWMRAGILVVENPYYAVVPEGGRFRIEGVPAGRYRVTAEHFDRRSQLEVDIKDGGSTSITVKL